MSAEPSPPRALLLNCTLKRAPEPSHTEALLERVAERLRERGAAVEILRPVEMGVAPGVDFDALGSGDGWPALRDRLLLSDILVVGTPIWMSGCSSVAQSVLERMYGVWEKTDPGNGRTPLHGKVAGCVTTGAEDGARHTASYVLYNLGRVGFAVPPFPDSYWVGFPGEGPHYRDGGDGHVFPRHTALTLADGLVDLAAAIRAMPFTVDMAANVRRAREAIGR